MVGGRGRLGEPGELHGAPETTPGERKSLYAERSRGAMDLRARRAFCGGLGVSAQLHASRSTLMARSWRAGCRAITKELRNCVKWSCQGTDVCDSVRLLYLLTYLRYAELQGEMPRSSAHGAHRQKHYTVPTSSAPACMDGWMGGTARAGAADDGAFKIYTPRPPVCRLACKLDKLLTS